MEEKTKRPFKAKSPVPSGEKMSIVKGRSALKKILIILVEKEPLSSSAWNNGLPEWSIIWYLFFASNPVRISPHSFCCLMIRAFAWTKFSKEDFFSEASQPSNFFFHLCIQIFADYYTAFRTIIKAYIRSKFAFWAFSGCIHEMPLLIIFIFPF